MGAFSLFLTKSIVVSGLLTTWYLLGLRGKRLHQYNRFFLLSTLFASLTIPFFHFQLFSIPHAAANRLSPVSLFIQSTHNLGNNLPATGQPGQIQVDWLGIASLLVAGVSFTLLLVLSVKVLKIWKLCRECAVIQRDGIKLILTDSPKAPFTFLKFLFWNKSIPVEAEIGQLIFRHELTHIEEGHTYDKLVCQVLTCLFWFNPFYWVIQKEMSVVHEFIADEHAIANRDTEAFAMMLLQSYSNGSFLAPEHYFFSSTVKRRLLMLQNAAKPSYPTLRRFMAIPLIASAILLFSFNVRNSITTHIAPAKKKIVLLLDAGHGGTDAGEQSGPYKEKDISLEFAKRIKKLSPAYNIDVQLTRDRDQDISLAQRGAIPGKTSPDLFISLHVGDEPGKEKGKGDFDMYVSGQNAYAIQSNNYSGAIFQAMEQDGIIPGIARGCTHDPNTPCINCRNAASKMALQHPENTRISSTEKEGVYVLVHARFPAMILVLGNIHSNEDMQRLTDDSRLDVLCNAVLKGIVDGATEKPITGQGCAPPSETNTNATTQVNFNNFTGPLLK